ILGTEAELRVDIKRTVAADCWGVYTTSADRCVVPKIYFSYRDGGSKEEDVNKKRQKIIADQTELCNDIENGLTVVLVMGQMEFKEIYYSKMQQIYLSIVVDHTVTWCRP